MRNLKTAVLAIATLTALSAYQNCGKANFSSSSSTSADGANGADGSLGGGLDPTCGSKIKVGNTCQDFSCTSVVEVTGAQLMAIPARAADGICYSYKLLNQVANGQSSLSGSHDPSIMARSHDVPGTNANPWLIGAAQGQFKVLGPRTVKIAASGSDPNAPIKVDNFIVTGVFPSGSNPNVATQYQARGTADASLLDNTGNGAGNGTGQILFNSVALPLQPFGSGGTGSVTPLDLTAVARPGVTQTYDVRALDCGGARELSDIYLLFQ